MRTLRADTYLTLERALDRFLGYPLLLLARLWTRLRTGNTKGRPSVAARILLIKFHGIGNLMMLLPAVRILRRHHPAASIDLLTFDTNREALPVMEGIEGGFFLERRNLWSLLTSTLRFLASNRKDAYDLIIDFEQFAYFSSVITVLADRGGLRIGYDNPAHRRASAYDIAVPYVESEHMASLFLKLVEAAGAKIPAELPCRLDPDPDHRAEVETVLGSVTTRLGGTLVVVHPGTSPNLLQRRWPPDRFAALADRLITRTGTRVVITGTSEERDLARRIRDTMRHEALDLTGRLSLTGFAALCAGADLVISNDTAAVHVAVAVGTPVAAFYGPNTPHLYGPPVSATNLTFYAGLPCSPCLRNTNRKLSRCRTPLCMDAISVEEAYQRIVPLYLAVTTPVRPVSREEKRLASSAAEAGQTVA